MSPFPVSLGRSIGSETARRRGRMLRWSILGSILFWINLFLGQMAVEQGWFTAVFTHTVFLGFIGYLLSATILDRTLFVPSIEGKIVVFVATSVPFLLLPLSFALLQIPYSRAALLLTYVSTAAWFGWGYRRYVGQYILRLGFLDQETANRFAEMIAPDELHETERGCERLILNPQQPHYAQSVSNCDGIVLDRYLNESAQRTRLLTELKLHHVRLYSLETAAEMLTGRMAISHVDDRFLELDGHPLNDIIKRILDICCVLLALPIVLPLVGVTAVLIRLDSPGSAFFSQRRIGRDGQAFRIWKLRSMRPLPPGAPAQFAAHNDPRITRLGRTLRKYRIDELPQLWNILRGDMSLIGPRPEQESWVHHFCGNIPYYAYRHLVRPGLSGWAQVQQGYADDESSTVTKLSYDLYYVKHCSLALDLLIFFKTLHTIVSGNGAR